MARYLLVVDARPGDQDPTAAIADEIHAGRRYAAIVISTLPASISRWVRMDVPTRVRRNFPGHRVIHVEAQRVGGVRSGGTAAVRSP